MELEGNDTVLITNLLFPTIIVSNIFHLERDLSGFCSGEKIFSLTFNKMHLFDLDMMVTLGRSTSSAPDTTTSDGACRSFLKTTRVIDLKVLEIPVKLLSLSNKTEVLECPYI